MLEIKNAYHNNINEMINDRVCKILIDSNYNII
jgi:hypothetical protein